MSETGGDLHSCATAKVFTGEEEIEAVVQVLRTWYPRRKNVREMEEKVAPCTPKNTHHGDFGFTAAVPGGRVVDYAPGAEIITPVSVQYHDSAIPGAEIGGSSSDGLPMSTHAFTVRTCGKTPPQLGTQFFAVRGSEKKSKTGFTRRVDAFRTTPNLCVEEPGYNVEPPKWAPAFGFGTGSQTARQHRYADQNIITTCANFLRVYEEHSSCPNSCRFAHGLVGVPCHHPRNGAVYPRRLQIFLEKTQDIQTRTVFTGNVARQRSFKNIAAERAQAVTEADKVMRRRMLLACHQGLSTDNLRT
ncbi:hypothetical protein FQR65_LT20898 [Abscondita terminalis]|nr:hypothetical protein FQR65_LT20898 [Abscondita terminalis]